MIVTALTETCDYNKPHAVSRKRARRIYFCTEENAIKVSHIKPPLFPYNCSRKIKRAPIA
jgi:hypothetical protein